MQRLAPLVAVLVAVLAPRARAAAARDGGVPAPVPDQLGSFTIVATGDIMMHEAEKQSAEAHGFSSLFAQVKPLLAGADVAFGNLETPVAPKANRGTKPFIFDAPVELLPALKDVGFTLLSFANNHAYDQGVAGVVETVGNLADAGLSQVGAGASEAAALTPVIVERRGLRVGFLGGTTRFNSNLNSGDPAKPYVVDAAAPGLPAAIAALAKTVDAVVVSVHWGYEYESEPAQEQVELAKKLVDAGALVILGSHPHVLQRVELLPAPDGRVALVAYSMGNFVSNQSRDYAEGAAPPVSGDPRDGVLVELTLRKRRFFAGLGGARVVTDIGKAAALPLWTDNNDLERKRSQKLAPDIHVVDLDAELKGDEVQLQALAVPARTLDAKQQDQAVMLQERVELLKLRRLRTRERLGGDYVAPRFEPSR